MAGHSRRWRLAGLLFLGACLTTGCSLPSLAYFVMTGFQEPKEEARGLNLAPSDGKESKVVIVAYAGSTTSTDFVDFGRELGGRLMQQLQEHCKENKDKITFVSHGKVQDYLNKHSNWYLDPREVGKHFEADKVVFLEIQGISLYEKGSANQLYRGRATINIKLFDLRNPDDFPKEKMFNCEYPSTKGPIPVDDKKPRE
ncbi:MAG TPA: hypothetical protein VGY77_03315, partial [Gemmataceae bacterium]|nr:hypothetical protein [Gemmataceae bacterium]